MKTYSISGLSRELGIDRRRLTQICDALPPVETKPHRRFFLKDVFGALVDQDAEGESTEALKKRKLAAEARIKEFEYHERARNAISVEDHCRVIGNIADACRVQLMALPSKLAHQMACETAPAVCQNLIDDEVRKTLTDLARIIADDSIWDD